MNYNKGVNVGLRKMLGIELRRREPVERFHGEGVGAVIMDSDLRYKVVQRKEGMTRIKVLLVLAMAAFHFAVVTRSVRTDKPVANTEL